MLKTRRRSRDELRLEIVRFRKLIADNRKLMAVVADAREKAGGDYIFDRRYIVTLVDDAVTLAGLLVFHGGVLAPDGLDDLERRFERIRAAGRDLLVSPATGAAESEAAPLAVPQAAETAGETEFRLLHAVIRWLDGPLASGRTTVMDLSQRILEQAVAGSRMVRNLDADADRRPDPDGMQTGRIGVIDLQAAEDRGTARPARATDLHEGTLKLLLRGAEAGEAIAGAANGTTTSRPVAVIDGERMSLFARRGRDRIRAEATLTGDAEADFVFIGAVGSGEPLAAISPRLKTRPTPHGCLAWSHGGRTRDLEDTLLGLGRWLFAGTSDGGRRDAGDSG